MRTKLLGALTIAVLLLLVFAVVAQAAVPQSTIDAIIKDAGDNGTIDGNWTSAQIRAALTYAQDNPVVTQYSGIRGVLEDYLASLQAPGAQGGQLAFTGGEIFLILAAGAALMGGGLVLRRAQT